MDKYQKFILDRTVCFISSSKELDPNATKNSVTSFVNESGEFLVKQVENYNIKKHFILFSGVKLASVEVDGSACELIETPKHELLDEKTIVVPVDFDKQAKEIKISFRDGLANPLTLKLCFVEADHSIYDSKVQAEINQKICPEHKTGIDLVNIYWNLVSDNVETTQINLYFVSNNSERLISKFKESGAMFKSVTGLAFGTYRYEVIEFDKNGKELARTQKIEFKLSAPNYGRRQTVVSQ